MKRDYILMYLIEQKGLLNVNQILSNIWKQIWHLKLKILVRDPWGKLGFMQRVIKELIALEIRYD